MWLKSFLARCNSSSSNNIKTPTAVKIKDDVKVELHKAMAMIENLRDAFLDNATRSLIALKEQMKELNASMKEVKEATKVKATGPWATQHTITATLKPAPDRKVLKVREQKTATRQEHIKCEVTLRSKTEDTKKKLQAMSYKDITERIQATINTNVHCDEKPTLFGVSKPTKDGNVRIRCETEEQAKMLRHINWKPSLEGLQAREPKFGIVIHAVNKEHFNVFMDTNKPTAPTVSKKKTRYQSSKLPHSAVKTRTSPNTNRVSYSPPIHMLPTTV